MNATRRYSITQATQDTADALRDRDDQSPTTIRCALNDALEFASRDGMRVNSEYDQARAVKRVRRLLGRVL
jgi:hypothetical protein